MSGFSPALETNILVFLLLGWGGLITQPLALTFGKRPVYLVSMLGNLGTVIWMVYIRSESEWLANKILQGLFASPIEMLIEISIADIVSGRRSDVTLTCIVLCPRAWILHRFVWDGFVWLELLGSCLGWREWWV